MIAKPAEQEVCQRCGAWLPVRPDFAEFVTYVRERPDPKCPHRSPTDSEVWSPFAVDNFYCDECVLEETVEEWQYRFSCLDCGWPRERTDRRGPSELFPPDLRDQRTAGERPAGDTWRLPRSLIVHINYAAARHAHVADASDLARLPSLLDHGGRRVARWGSVYEDDGADPHKVRLSLARLRHARRDGEDARCAWLLCERAVLAVNAALLAAPILARRIGPDGQPGPLEVAPVLGAGGLGIEGRYDAWMALHQGYPWLFDPAEKWHDRMRRRFAGLPDPEIATAAVPQHLWPLWQFVDVADTLALFARRSRHGGRLDREADGIALRVEVFKELCARGELARKLPYEPELREPGYLPDYQQGSESDFV